jgi:hypothetical protein
LKKTSRKSCIRSPTGTGSLGNFREAEWRLSAAGVLMPFRRDDPRAPDLEEKPEEVKKEDKRRGRLWATLKEKNSRYY